MSAVLCELVDLTMLRSKMSKNLHKQLCENTLLSAASDDQVHFSIIYYKIQSFYVLMSHCFTWLQK